MKCALGILLVGLGLVAIVLCLTLRVQFNTLATEPGSQNPDDYPLLQFFIPTQASSDAPADVTEIARTVTSRINFVGIAGVVLIIVGTVVCVGGRRQQSMRGVPPGPGDSQET